MPQSALEGLTVVGLSNSQTGARVSQFLADFGAEVVEIEAPGGSPLRADPAWPFWGRGKKSVELDLKDPADAEVARRLASGADVVIDTFRPGVADRLGLGYEALAAANPRLIYASITGFGRQGPFAQLKGYEGLVMAKIGGLEAFGRMVERPGPALPVVQYASFSAAQTALHGILAALFERERSGRGQWVEANLVQGLAAHDSFNWFVKVVSDRFPGAFFAVPTIIDGVPSGGLMFRLLNALTADGHWLQFSQVSDRLFRAFMRAVDLEWMFDDPKWRTAPEFEDTGQRIEYWESLLEAVRSKTLAEWQKIFDDDPNVWGELHRHGQDLLDHPQMAYDHWVTEVDDPALGPMRQLAPMVKMPATPGTVGSAPGRDEHAAELRVRAAPPPATPSGPAPTRPPLEGITIVELAYYYAAPYGATLLTDLGARVIKLEPTTGDEHRYMLPAFPDTAAIKALQGKESVAVDLATAEGREIAYDVVRNADAVLQSFRAGTAARLGLDPDTLMAVNPNLIYLSAPGYGIDGPCGHRPAYAPTIAAGAGIGWRNSGGTIPESTDLSLDEVKTNALRLWLSGSGVASPDGCAALGAATALLLGLLARQRGAGGQALQTSMLSTTAHTLADDMIEYAGRGPAATADHGLFGLSARYRLYEAAEGWVFLAAPTEREWAPLVAALAPHIDLGADDRFATEAGRHEHDEALVAALGEAFRRQPAAAWEAELIGRDVACVEVGSGPFVEGWLMNPAMGEASGYVAETVHPTIGEHPRLAPLVRFSRSETLAGPAPLLGQDTLTVLAELGYSEERVQQLLEAGVIGV